MGLYEFKREDAERFASEKGYPARIRGDELQFRFCPYCHGGSRHNRDTFSINLRSGQFKCLRASCGVTGNMITLSRDFDFSLGNSVDEYYRPRKRYRNLATPKEPIKPKDPAVRYLESRGISAEIARRYEITVQRDYDNILVFPFFDESGKLRFVKYRKTDFDPEKDKNKEWCEANCKPILFGMKQCSENRERLIITEGQLDSLSVAEAGIENAVSVPTGAKGFTWVPYCFDWVMQFNEIVVFGDHEKGHITLLDDISRRFDKPVRHVQEEDYLGCKDANEILQKHGPAAVRNAVKNAVLLPVERVISLADVEAVNVYELPKLKTGIKELDSLLYGGLPFGCVAVISGKRGDGKSTLASQFLARAINQGYPVFAYSGELPNYLFKSWIDFQIAGPCHIVENRTTLGVAELIQGGIDVTENMEALYKQMSGLIAKIAWRYRSLEEVEDLKQEGYLGLYKAALAFSPAAGVPFYQYAALWIRQKIRRYIENCGSVVRIPSGQKKLLYQYRKLCSSYFRSWADSQQTGKRHSILISHCSRP